MWVPLFITSRSVCRWRWGDPLPGQSVVGHSQEEGGDSLVKGIGRVDGCIFLNFFINMSAMSARRHVLGEIWGGSRHFPLVVHACEQGRGDARVLPRGGRTVDGVEEFLGVLRQGRLEQCRGMRQTRRGGRRGESSCRPVPRDAPESC